MFRLHRPRCRPLEVATIAVVVALSVTACSGGGTPLGAKAFAKQANAQCAKLAAASEDLGLAQSEGAVGEEVQGYVEGAADRLRDLAEGLADLRPPESLESDTEELAAALGDYADGLDDIAASVDPGQGLTEALDSSPKLVARLNRLADRSSELVGVLGLDGCQLAG